MQVNAGRKAIRLKFRAFHESFAELMLPKSDKEFFTGFWVGLNYHDLDQVEFFVLLDEFLQNKVDRFFKPFIGSVRTCFCFMQLAKIFGQAVNRREIVAVNFTLQIQALTHQGESFAERIDFLNFRGFGLEITAESEACHLFAQQLERPAECCRKEKGQIGTDGTDQQQKGLGEVGVAVGPGDEIFRNRIYLVPEAVSFSFGCVYAFLSEGGDFLLHFQKLVFSFEEFAFRRFEKVPQPIEGVEETLDFCFNLSEYSFVQGHIAFLNRAAQKIKNSSKSTLNAAGR